MAALFSLCAQPVERSAGFGLTTRGASRMAEAAAAAAAAAAAPAGGSDAVAAAPHAAPWAPDQFAWDPQAMARARARQHARGCAAAA
jgi:hypothetical protein